MNSRRNGSYLEVLVKVPRKIIFLELIEEKSEEIFLDSIIFLILCLGSSVLIGQVYASDFQVEVAPIKKVGAADDLLLEDPIVSVTRQKMGSHSGSGSIQNSIQNQIALPIADPGRPGNVAQVRGLGATAEEVDVQAFGISLSPPQGGGFDLSAFPQFLWSDFHYRSGPSLNSLNQTASAGTLVLIPWTLRALHESGGGASARGTGFFSSQGVNQVSAGVSGSEKVALIGGYSSGKVIGPSAGLSGRWDIPHAGFSAHFLGSALDAEVTGSTRLPSPRARMKSQRILPVLQGDFKLTQSTLLKTSFFYDSASVDYGDPDQDFYSNSNIQQWGFQNLLIWNEWKWGLSGRQVSYLSSSAFEAPLQTLVNIQVSQLIERNHFILEPSLQGVWVSGFGFLPQGSLGARKEWNRGQQALYSRVLVSHRIPSLLDRYSTYLEFVGNPELQTELDWTGILGAELKSDLWEGSIQAYAQLRQDARVSLGSTVTNLGEAYIAALTGTAQVKLSPNLNISNATTVSQSRLFATHSSFPYIPVWMNVASLRIHSRPAVMTWEWLISLRGEGSRGVGVLGVDSLASYAVVDLAASMRLWQASIGIRCENVFDRNIELIQGYPLGRTLSMSASAEL